MSAVVEAREPSAKYLSALQPPLVLHFELMATAPGGVAKLRELILSLAVQGKLVPQDPKDEPASVLLKNIQAQKERLFAIGALKKEKRTASQVVEDLQAVLPRGWEACRLSQLILSIRSGGTPSKQNSDYWDGDIPWASVKDLRFGEPISDTQDKITKAGLDAGSELAPAGSILICTRMGLGKIGEALVDIAINQDLKAVQLGIGVNKQYFINYFKTLPMVGSGMTVAGIKQDELLSFFVPLPPAAEQARIVTRVEELMRLCDALEAKGQLEAAQHAQLVQTLLGALTASATPEELAGNWQRVATHFDSLLDRPEAIDALEQTILQLAVRGLLVPQDPKDEPASELLKKIPAEKERLIAAGRIKREKPLPTIEEIPFTLPSGWTWTRLGVVGESFTYGSSQKACDDASAVPILRMGNIQGGKVLMGNLKYLKDLQDELPSLLLEKGDVLFNRTNSYELVGKTGIFQGDDRPVTFASYLIRIRFMEQFCSPEYANLYMNTSDCRANEIEPDLTQQTGQANYNGTKLRNIRFPLPPREEQSRIVARVRSLRGLCADLRQRLAARQAIQTHLAEALIAEVA